MSTPSRTRSTGRENVPSLVDRHAYLSQIIQDGAIALGATVGLVYNIKAGLKKKPGAKKGKRGRKPGMTVAAKATAPQGVHHALDAAFEFIHKVGGVLHAEQLIAKLKSLKERL